MGLKAIGVLGVSNKKDKSLATGFDHMTPNGDGTAEIYYKDGSHYTTTAIKGDKGDKGDALTWADLTDAQKDSLKGEDGKTVQILEVGQTKDDIADSTVLAFGLSDETVDDSYTKTQSDVRYAKSFEVGDITKLTVNTWTDLVDAINKTWLAGAESFVFDSATRSLNLTTRGGKTISIDVSQIILNTSIGDFKDVLITNVLDGQSLVYNASKKKWIPKSIDSSGVLVEAKTYTDDEIKKINAKATIVCDEKPTYYGGVTTYIKGGVEKTTEQTGVWFYYHDDDGNASQTIFPDGTEFTIAMTGDVDLDGYLQDEDVTDTYDKDFVDKTKIPNTQYMSDFKADIDDELSDKVDTSDVTDTLGLSADGIATASTVSEDKIPNLKALNELHTMLNGTLFKKADIIAKDDDTTVASDDNVYSAFKVDKLLDDIIDDTTASDETVYSSEKVDALMHSAKTLTATESNAMMGYTNFVVTSSTATTLGLPTNPSSSWFITHMSPKSGYTFPTQVAYEDSGSKRIMYRTCSNGTWSSWVAISTLDKVSNPNLLDNPWFTVNQRGQTSYSTQGYTFDRWKLSLEGGTVTKLDDGSIRFEKTTTSYNLNVVQYIPLDGLAIGKTYTLSIKMSDGTIYSDSGNMVSATSLKTLISINIPNFGLVALKTHPTEGFNYVLIQGLGGVGSSIDVKAVKLELGTVSTLANDVAPNYGTELLKCQRYYKRIGGRTNTVIGSGQGNTTRVFVNVANITVPMRAKPTVTTTSSQIKMIGNGESVTADISSIALDEYYFYDNTDLKIRINTENNGMTKLNNYSYDCRFNDAGYIELSADL